MSPKFKPQGNISRIEDFYNKGHKPINHIYKHCLFPYSNVFVNPQGDIFPCLSVIMGNIRENKLKDIYNNEKYISFRKKLKESKLFNSCQMCCKLVPKNI